MTGMTTVGKLKEDLAALKAFKDSLWNNLGNCTPMDELGTFSHTQTLKNSLRAEIAKCEKRIENIKKLLEEKQNDK